MAYPNPTLSLGRRVLASLATGLAVALAAHVATVLVFFAAAGADPSYFGSFNSYFQSGSLIVFVLVALAAALEAFDRWYTALAAALAIAVIAAYFGTLINLVAAGSAIDAAAIDYLLGSLIGPNLLFIVAVIAVAMTVGVSLWRYLTKAPVRRDRRIALVRLPSSNIAEGQVTHIERSVVDAELADTQWEGYVAAMDAHGWDVVEVAVADDHADSVFIEDTAVIFGDTAVIGSPGSESRIGETEAVELTLREHGLRIERIELPGTLDGGDVLKVGTTVYVGRGGRTNAEGIRQLRRLVTPLGYSVVAVPVTKALHLKTAVTALPDGTVIGYPPLVDEPGLFERFLAVPEAEGTAVVVLDEATVLISAAAPQSAALIAELGYEVVTVDISEFEKLEGCVTCLSVRIR